MAFLMAIWSDGTGALVSAVVSGFRNGSRPGMISLMLFAILSC